MLFRLSFIEQEQKQGDAVISKLRELIPRQQFLIALQASIGARIVAGRIFSAVRKNVTAKCYGGRFLVRKLLEKQKEGKKRMKQFGSWKFARKPLTPSLKQGTNSGMNASESISMDLIRFSNLPGTQVELNFFFRMERLIHLLNFISYALVFIYKRNFNTK